MFPRNCFWKQRSSSCSSLHVKCVKFKIYCCVHIAKSINKSSGSLYVTLWYIYFNFFFFFAAILLEFFRSKLRNVSVEGQIGGRVISYIWLFFLSNNPTHRFIIRRSIILFQDDCQNYIRVAFKKNDEELFVCGTNAFHPMCRMFNLTVSRNNILYEMFVFTPHIRTYTGLQQIIITVLCNVFFPFRDAGRY